MSTLAACTALLDAPLGGVGHEPVVGGFAPLPDPLELASANAPDDIPPEDDPLDDEDPPDDDPPDDEAPDDDRGEGDPLEEEPPDRDVPEEDAIDAPASVAVAWVRAPPSFALLEPPEAAPLLASPDPPQ